MAKRLKLRLSRILSSCRSKHDPSTLPSNPVPSFLRLPKLSPSLPAGQTFRWKQDENFHVISISTSHTKPPLSSDTLFTPPRPSLAERVRRRRLATRRKKHRKFPSRHSPGARLSTDCPLETATRRRSKAAERESDGGGGDREETENLISSTSSSDDGGSGCGTDVGRRERSCVAEEATAEQDRLMRRRVSEVEFEARLSAVEGERRGRKVRDSYAVVKRTEDPYGEFKRSMMEMVTEKEMYEEEELEEMLRCLLSLNGREHHGVILRAFAEVWDALFRRRSSVGNRDYRQR